MNSTSTKATSQSNDSNSTITQESQNRSRMTTCVSDDSSTALGDLSNMDLKASVTDDASVSDGQGDHANTMSFTASSPSSPGSGLNSPKSPETPSSRSSLISPVAHRMPSQAYHWSGYADDKETVLVHNDWPDIDAIHSGLRSQESEKFTSSTVEVPGEHAHMDERRHSSDTVDHPNSLKVQEEALLAHLVQSRHPQRFNEYVNPTPGPEPDVQFPRYYPPRAIEHGSPVWEQSGHGSAQVASGQAPMPVAPDAPDLSKTTLVGYEQLAKKLSEAPATIRPAYRKFEALHHRILLHVQDELCELEEHLRRLDEISAQIGHRDESGTCLPSSRRAEAYYGSEIHTSRTQLLGQIFVKLEQYRRSNLVVPMFTHNGASSCQEVNTNICTDRALSAYSGVTESMDRPGQDDISRYRDWMAVNRPVHQSEATFLGNDNDLVTLARHPRRSVSRPEPSIVLLAFMPFVPLGKQEPDNMMYGTSMLTNGPVAFLLVPMFLGRVLTTAAMTAASWWYISATESRLYLRDRDWAIGVVAYVVPPHT